ncbi:MAG: zinc ribbon domain-containing protein [Defluviitaleaceae bacterium]|nr:zinc ribbon domain-containing protein [Defluviitaleaceae bacterium]
MPTQTPLCQSCAMPMDAPEKFGQEANGSQNKDYCCHCWKKGKFAYKSTLEQAVENNIPWWREEGDENDDAARARIMEVFPKLKRWANE